MNARFFSILFLFTFLFAVLAAPVPDPVPELQSEENELDARGLEARGYTGDGTYYDVGLGSCGKTNKNSEMVVALSMNKYKKTKCGKYITVKYKGKSVKCKVVDSCVGCGPNDVDLSPAAFSKLASKSVGRMKVTWSFT